jgi:NAD(P)-dependent dehydrogenase (short-subunit alcohol dehydrogenase family)
MKVFRRPSVLQGAALVAVSLLGRTQTAEGFSFPLFSSSINGSGEVSRRGWVKQVVGGAVLAGAVANKIAIRGPTPFQPAPGSLNNKVIVITGGNTGLGYESAKRLAKGGATIVITSRSLTKGQKAVDAIKQETGNTNNNVFVVSLDLCDLENVKSFPQRLKATLGEAKKIDVLMNNAGVMAVPDRELTKDGYEKQFQTNHLGHFALTASLMPMMNKENARVINVSSAAHQFAGNGLDFNNLNGEQEYAPWGAYGASKLENIFFTKELQKRVDDSNTFQNFKAMSLHPGAVRTDLARYMMGEEDFVSMMDTDTKPAFSLKSTLLLPLVYFTKSVDRGATTQIWLAAGQGDDELKGGEYLQNTKVTSVAAFAQDMDAASKLWDVSENLAGIKFNL